MYNTASIPNKIIVPYDKSNLWIISNIPYNDGDTKKYDKMRKILLKYYK